MQIQGVQKQRRAVAIVAEVWGGEIAVSKDTAAHMRSVAMAHNEALTRRTRRERAKAKEVKKRSEIHMPPLNSEFGFVGLKTGFTGYGTWDCPEMDPMSCGSWWVRLNMNEEQEVRRQAA